MKVNQILFSDAAFIVTLAEDDQFLIFRTLKIRAPIVYTHATIPKKKKQPSLHAYTVVANATCLMSNTSFNITS